MRSLLSSWVLMSSLLVAAALTGCVTNPEAPSHFNPGDPEAPGSVSSRPSGMTAEAGDRQVTLSWGAPAAGGVTGYHLYRASDESGTGTFSAFELISTGDSTRYVDADVINDVEYRYRVAAVLTGEQEGEASIVVSAVPSVYTASLEGGALYTRSREVILALTAPAGTSLVRVADDSTMAGASFVAFSARLPWTLSPGDGVKRLFVEFRGPHGESSRRIPVSIELDTVASIRQVTVNGAAGTVAPGATVGFVVETGEADGVVTVDIGSRARGVRLYDDGTHGDAAAGNGTYQLDYLVPGGEDVADAAVIAHFEDRAGNTASDLASATRLTIGVAPAAVTLAAPADSTISSLRLNWSTSTATDFSSYRLYRSTTAGVDTSQQRVLVTEISDAATGSFNDTGLNEDTSYHYLVYVYDRSGLHTASNEVTGRTANRLPGAVTLQPASAISTSGLTLSWDESSAADFGAYLVFRDTAAGVDTTATRLATITRRDQHTFDVSGLTENRQYYFRIFTRDRGGLLTGSNEVSALTANLPPDPPVLNPPTAITDTGATLSWIAVDDHDFREYRVYRDTTAAVTESSPRIRTIADRLVTGFIDSGLRENTRYYYRLYNADTGDSVAASAVQAITTQNRQPTPVTLEEPDSSHVTSTTASLTWSRSDAHDFQQYRVYRSTTPGVTTSGSPVFATTLNALTFFDDTGLTAATTYYYRVFVQDTGGLETGSNEIRIRTD